MLTPGVHLLDQPVQWPNMRIVDPASLVRHHIRELVRLRQQEPRVCDHSYSLAEMPAICWHGQPARDRLGLSLRRVLDAVNKDAASPNPIAV